MHFLGRRQVCECVCASVVVCACECECECEFECECECECVRYSSFLLFLQRNNLEYRTWMAAEDLYSISSRRLVFGYQLASSDTADRLGQELFHQLHRRFLYKQIKMGINVKWTCSFGRRQLVMGRVGVSAVFSLGLVQCGGLDTCGCALHLWSIPLLGRLALTLNQVSLRVAPSHWLVADPTVNHCDDGPP